MELSQMPFTHRWYCGVAPTDKLCWVIQPHNWLRCASQIVLLSLEFPLFCPNLSMIYEFILYLYSQHYCHGLSKVTGLLKFHEPFRRPYLKDILPANSPNRVANASPIEGIQWWPSSSSLRRETAVAGPSFLAASTTLCWPDYRIQDIHGSFEHEPNWFFSPTLWTRP